LTNLSRVLPAKLSEKGEMFKDPVKTEKKPLKKALCGKKNLAPGCPLREKLSTHLNGDSPFPGEKEVLNR